jgi:hypothetical protein
MIHDQDFDQCKGNKPFYCPTTEEIRQACRAIQSTWSEAERARRMGLLPRSCGITEKRPYFAHADSPIESKGYADLGPGASGDVSTFRWEAAIRVAIASRCRSYKIPT